MTIPVGQNPIPVYLTNTPLATHLTNTPISTLSTINEALSSRGALSQLRTIEPRIVFASSMQYDMSPILWQTTATGAGNVAAHDANARHVTLTLGGTNAGSVVRQTYQYVPYQEGRSQLILMTGIMGAATENVTQRLGYFDAANGLFFQQTATAKSVVRRSSVSGVVVDTVVEQSGWNLDRLDGNGSSGITIDWTKDQIYVIDFLWLGTGRVRFGVYSQGQIVYCHAMDHANLLATSYTQSGTLPLRYEISCSAPASATLIQICQAVASEGGYFDLPGYQFCGVRPVGSMISTASEAPLIALRPAATLNSIVNRAYLKMATISVLSASGSFAWRLLYYPPGSTNPITGGAWAAATNSATEFNVSGTALSLTGAIPITAGYVPTGVGASHSVADVDIAQFYPLTLDASGANPAYLVVSGLGAGATGGAAVTVTEIR